MKKQSGRLFRSTIFMFAILFGFAVPSQAQELSPEALAAISAAMDNPISELIMFQFQYDQISIDLPNLDQTKSVGAFKFIPTFPIPLGSKLNWVSRIMLPVNSLPLNDAFGDLLGVAGPDAPLTGGGTNIPPDVIEDITSDPFKRTTGFGDLVYIGLVGPRKAPKVAGNTLIYALGATSMFPTGSKEILTLGKTSIGPAAVAVYLPGKFRMGFLAQHWKSIAGDDKRADVSLSNIQYFLFYLPNPLTAIGLSPNIVINHEATGDKVTFPIGIGANRTFQFGKLPVRLGMEFHYDVISPSDKAGAQWSFRFYVVPVIPAPWGELGKAIKKGLL